MFLMYSAIRIGKFSLLLQLLLVDCVFATSKSATSKQYPITSVSTYVCRSIPIYQVSKGQVVRSGSIFGTNKEPIRYRYRRRNNSYY